MKRMRFAKSLLYL